MLILNAQQRSQSPSKLRYFLKILKNVTYSRHIDKISFVEAEIVAESFLMPTTSKGKVIRIAVKINDDDYENVKNKLTKFIEKNFDIVPSFLWRSLRKKNIWNVVRIRYRYKKIRGKIFERLLVRERLHLKYRRDTSSSASIRCMYHHHR